MNESKTYRDLDVWQQGRFLVKQIYELSRKFPKDEQFGLTTQLRRAAISIPSNLAEGCGRNHIRESIQFFFVARGSLYEVETQMIIAIDLGYVTESDSKSTMDQITRCKKLINGFINYYQTRTNNEQPTTINEIAEEYGNSN